jgi:VWFA-related protein
MHPFRLALAAAIVFAVGGDLRLTSQARSPQAAQPYTSAATAVLVDVVVRDRQGRPVLDLAAADFALAEDGVPQTIDSFTRVSRGGGIGVGISWRSPRTTIETTTAGTPNAPAAERPRGDGTTAIVFDHLSSESLRLAQRAALDYIPLAGEATDRVGVFATDPGIRVVQGYTTDRARVRQAVGRVLPSGTSAQEQKAERTDELMARRRDLRGQTASTVAGSAGVGGAALAGMASAIGERETELRMLQTELNMIRSFDNLDRDHRGYDTSLALLSVVRSLAEYPGRKAIVLFSEGLPVSPVLSARLDHVIDAANRANITAYAVDASGLRAKSTLTGMRREIDGFVEERLQQLATGTERTEQPLAMAFERIEDTLTLDSRAGLARLADQTGGLLFEASNDLSSVFRRIDEDNQFHYVLTYSPRNTAFDGKFRAINVKVSRPGTQVFARKGYRAARAAGGRAPGGESAALAMLTRRPLPNAFETHAAGFTFPDPARPGLAALLVRVRTGVLRFDVDPDRSTYTGETAILVRIRDGDGREVQKVSQEYLLAGDARNVEAARNGEILFYREVDLHPGVYTMESIVFDSTARQGSARVATLTVPVAAPSALGMSSLLLVDRVEQLGVTSTVGADDIRPLYVGRTLIYPNLGQPIRKGATSELPFFFTLYGAAAGTSVQAQLLRNGQALAEAPVQVASDAGTRAQHLGRLPIDALTPGTYELRIRAKSGAHEVSQAAFFTLMQ